MANTILRSRIRKPKSLVGYVATALWPVALFPNTLLSATSFTTPLVLAGHPSLRRRLNRRRLLVGGVRARCRLLSLAFRVVERDDVSAQVHVIPLSHRMMRGGETTVSTAAKRTSESAVSREYELATNYAEALIEHKRSIAAVDVANMERDRCWKALSAAHRQLSELGLAPRLLS